MQTINQQKTELDARRWRHERLRLARKLKCTPENIDAAIDADMAQKVEQIAGSTQGK